MTAADPPEPDPPATRAPTTGDRTFRRWATAVGVASTVVFTWMVTLGRWDLFQERAFSGMLDVQARALLDGHLWVPDGSLGFEGFVVDGRTYAYFGVFPSILRIPVFLVTDRLDGRLTAASMLLAFVLAQVAVTRLVSGLHRLVRPGAAWTRGGLVVAVALVAAVGLGSNLLYLASGAWVYHEATLWGVAAVLASFAAIVAWAADPRGRHLVAAGAWGLVAWTSRGSVGLGPSVALGLLALAVLFPSRLTRALGPVPAAVSGDRRRAVPLLAAAAVGAVAFASVNLVKFGSPTDLPMDKQLQSIDPAPSRAAALEAYDGTIFSPKVVPSVAVQMLRPDLVRPSAVWPFVDLTRRQPPRLAAPVFDTVEPSAGLTVTHPLALALGVAGVAALAGRRRRVPALAIGRPLVLGSLLGTLPVLTIAFISQRYVTDLLPPVLVAAAVGAAALDRWLAERAERPAPEPAAAPAGHAAGQDRPTGRAAEPEPAAEPTGHAEASTGRRTGGRDRPAALVCAAALLLGVAGTYVTLSTTWIVQRRLIAPDVEARRSWIRATSAVAEVVGRRPSFDRAASIHDVTASADDLLVVGDCDGLYFGQGDGVWSPVETTAAVGVPRLRVTGRPAPGGEPVTLLRAGDLEVRLVATAPAGPGSTGGEVRVDLVRAGAVTEGRPFAPGAGPIDLEVDLDGNLPSTHVSRDGADVAFAPQAPPTDRFTLAGGAEGVEGVEVRPLPTPTPTCRALTGT